MFVSGILKIMGNSKTVQGQAEGRNKSTPRAEATHSPFKAASKPEVKMKKSYAKFLFHLTICSNILLREGSVHTECNLLDLG